MTRDPMVYIDDIREAIIKIEKYVGALSKEDFLKNEMIIDAIDPDKIFIEVSDIFQISDTPQSNSISIQNRIFGLQI